MGSSYRRILPEVLAAVSACLDKSPGREDMIENIHKLGKDSPARDLQRRKRYYDKLRIKIPRSSIVFHLSSFVTLLTLVINLEQK